MEKNLNVTLTLADISNIAKDMNDEFCGGKPSQIYLEYLLCLSIRRQKGINFFSEMDRITDKLDEKDIKQFHHRRS